MTDHRDDKGINFRLPSIDRKYFMDIILKVYPSSSKFKRALVNMDDNQLMGFALDLIDRKKLNVNRPVVYARALKQFIGAHTYELDTFGNGEVIYFGQYHGRETIQTGIVYLNSGMVITECWLLGQRVKRFEKMEMRLP